jgi:LmbE family N-acetylglucosaminyl deacetylase
VSEEHLAGYSSIAELRLAELDCAASYLGLGHVYKFGYRDSGMMGTPANDHPDSLWQADQNDVARRIVEVIRRMQPQVVVTFDPHGGYGHPDHIKIHLATVQAFHEAADPQKYPEQLAAGLAPYQPQKLYYTMFPRGMIRLAVAIVRLLGRDPRRMGTNDDMDFQAVLEATLPSHARLDLRADYDAWQAASACHASQSGPGQMVPLPRFLSRLIFGWQTFHRAYPMVNGESPHESDLFEGLE